MVENAVVTAYCLNPKTLPRCMHGLGGNWSQVGGRSNDRARLIQSLLAVRGFHVRLLSGPLTELGKFLTCFRDQRGKSATADGLLVESVQPGVIEVARPPRQDKSCPCQPSLTRSLYRPLIVLNVFCLVTTISDAVRSEAVSIYSQQLLS